MRPFDTVAILDWSAGKRRPPRPSKDSIWMGVARGGKVKTEYIRTRVVAQGLLSDLMIEEKAAKRRLLVGFDFPFGYPGGFARRLTGTDDPFEVWWWITERIEDDASGVNNRYEVAEEINALFDGPGPFWGKPSPDEHPGIPYRKAGISYDAVPEWRACDLALKSPSSCFQLAFPPTVGGQTLMGLPTLWRLRSWHDAGVWPLDDHWRDADIVLAETWTGLIEPAVKARPEGEIRDEAQVRMLARALSLLPAPEFEALMSNLPDAAREEAWTLGIGAGDRLCELADPLKPPPLADDCFALPPGVDWTPVDAALDRLRERLHPIAGKETVPVADSAGRVLYKDLRALRSNPPAANSAVDGYGFAHASNGGGPRTLPLIEGRAAAGVPHGDTVPAGHAIRILTGATLPDGVDTVVLDEDTRTDGARVAFNEPPKARVNTRKAGEDVARGKVFLEAGRRLTPADLALCAALGHGRIPVRKRLRVGVLSTGDELTEPGSEAGEDRIFDANRPMLLSLIARWGMAPVDLGLAADRRDAVASALSDARTSCDAVLTSGGASAGDEDHVSALLRESGAMAEWRVAIKPGRPLALGTWEGTPIFGLPGNPVAALVCSLVFARPALGLMAGENWLVPRGVMVPAAFSKDKKPGRREYLRARLNDDGHAEVFPSEGSGRISGLSWATGLVELGDGARRVEPGDPVAFLSYAAFDG